MSIKQNKYLYNILYVYKLSNSCLSILTSSYSSSWGEYNFNITPVLITLYISDLTSAHPTDPQDFTIYRSHRYKRFYSLQILQILKILQFIDLTDTRDFTVYRSHAKDFTSRTGPDFKKLAFTDSGYITIYRSYIYVQKILHYG